MSRAPFQVLVLPYRITRDNAVLYALFKRESFNRRLLAGSCRRWGK